jgi:PAS domain S-box-containing protein
MKRTGFSINIIAPAVLSLVLFVLLIFLLIIPNFEESIIEQKKVMIKELTNSAWSILNEMDQEVQKGIFTIEEAKDEAILIVKNLKYGENFKDYFWITDMHPRMIIHPYRPDLKGADLNEYSDPEGKKLFVECVKVVESTGEGYVNYMWQYKEDESNIVPKLSYVKGFKKWNWVVGTGIYIEDIKLQISDLKKKLLLISFLISGLIGLILFYLVRSNLITEHKRSVINEKLEESHEKYKTLVDASTEGIIMILNNEKAFYNMFVIRLLGYENEEFKDVGIYDIIYEKDRFTDLLDKNNQSTEFPVNIETKLKRKTGELYETIISLSRINFHGEDGFILGIKDISLNKKIEQELDQNIEKFKAITDNIDVGIFRTTIGTKGRFIEINKYAKEILGYNENEDLSGLNILDLFYSSDEKKNILNNLNQNKNISKETLKIKKPDGTVITCLTSLFLVNDPENKKKKFCDGIIQDITMQKKLEKEKDLIVEELMTAGMFMNSSVKSIAHKLPSCEINTTIHEAISLMVKKKSEAVLVHIEENKPIGIITDTDLGERIISKELDLKSSVSQIMSAPLITLPEHAMLFEALILMREKDVSHVCIEDVEGSVTEAVNIKEIAHAKYQTHTLLLQRIKIADSYEELKDIFDSIPLLLKILIESGAKTDVITRINSNFSHEITEKIIEFTLKNFEEPPIDFAFMTLGSVGRGEQTFLTDQDNALIFEDVDEERYDSVKEYFLKLAEVINKKLNEIGYNLCEGEIMAMNPKWCLSLSEWKDKYGKWIINSSPQDLIDVNIFFDIRHSGGKKNLTDSLRDYIYEIVKDRNLFFYHLADNVLSIKPPISFFGNFIVESTKENKSVFDIKKVIMLINSIARLYTLKNNIKETNTLRRLFKLNQTGVFSDNHYKLLSKNYNYLMLMRLNHQLERIGNNLEPNNLISPKKLTEIERTTLKKIFSHLSDFQSKISLDFKGTIK